MPLYVDPASKIVNEGDSYVGADGTQYPPNFPKAEIPGLTQVIETQPPVDSSLIVTGFYVDGSNHQVWQTRPKTAEELKDEQVSSLRMQIIELESSATARRVREAVLTEEGRLWLGNLETQIAGVRVELAAALA